MGWSAGFGWHVWGLIYEGSEGGGLKEARGEREKDA